MSVRVVKSAVRLLSGVEIFLFFTVFSPSLRSSLPATECISVVLSPEFKWPQRENLLPLQVEPKLRRMRGAVPLLPHTQYMASRPNRYTKLPSLGVLVCLSHIGRLNRSVRPARLAASTEMLPHSGRYMSIPNILQVGYSR
jgi:hypothetical protein